MGENFTVLNRHLRVRAITAAERPRQGLEVTDRGTGRNLLDRIFPTRPGRRTNPQTRLLSSGPVRAILQQSFEHGGVRYSYRYTLYAGRYEVKLQLLVTNLGDEPARLESLRRGFLGVDQGQQIIRNIRDLQLYSVNYWTTTRKNILWINTSTNYGYGVSYHTPAWGELGITGWAMPRRDPEGIQYHVVPAGPGQAPPTSRTWTVDLNGRTSLGGLRDFVHEEKGARAVYKRGRWRRNQKIPILAPGQTRSFGLTITFYRASIEEAIRQFQQDDTRAPGVLNIYGRDGVIEAAGAPYFFKEDFEDASRWIKTEGAGLKVEDGRARFTAPGPGGAIQTAFTRDFMDPTELRGKVNLPEHAALKLSLLDLQTGEAYEVGHVTGDFKLLLCKEEGMDWAPGYGRAKEPGGKEHMGWKPSDWAYGLREAALRLELVRAEGSEGTEEPLWAELDHLEVGWISSEPPLVQSPPQDFPLTDVAVSFHIQPRTWGATDRGYQVEVAADREFKGRVGLYTIDNHQHKKHRESRPRDCIPEELYPKGTYYVRARALQVGGGHSPWSEPRSFTVARTYQGPSAPVRAVAPQNPLWLFIGGIGTFRKLHSRAPEELHPYMAALGGGGVRVSKDGEALELNGEKFTFPIMGRVAGHSTWGAADMASLERFLAANREAGTGQFLGWMQGEGGRAKMAFNARYLKLAAQYGGLWGTGAPAKLGASEEFYALLKRHSNYIFVLYHRQNPYKPLRRLTSSVGAWLTGRIGHLAVDMQWHTPKKTIPARKIRAVDWLQTYLVGLAYGAEIYTAETFMSDGPRWPQAVGYSPGRDRLGEAWTRALKPFMEDVVEHQLIPTRREVLDRVKVAFHPRPRVTTETARRVEYYPYDIVNAVHGVPTRWHQWVPDHTRYTIVPMLPVLATPEERDLFESVVDPYELYSTEAAINYLNLFYEETPNQAFAVRAGDSAVITNYEEKPPGGTYWGASPPGHPPVPVNAAPQYFYVGFEEGPVTHIDGEVAFREYLLARQYPDRFFLHSNYYRGETSTFTLHGREALSVEVVPQGALLSEKRTEDGKAVTLRVGHEHEEGAVRVIAR